MNVEGYELLRVHREGRIVTVEIAHPPMNLITGELLAEFDRVTTELAVDPEVVVAVFGSSTPGFFLCHAKYDDFEKLKMAEVPSTRDEVPMNAVHRITERLRSMDKVTIAQVDGRATGGGAAIVMACDLRYGTVESAVFNSFGVPMGTGLGGGATQVLPRLVGRSRATELILGALDLDAETAERWGYLTRALPAAEIGGYVDRYARRVAQCVPEVIKRTKGLIAQFDSTPLAEGLRDENFALQQLAARPEAADAIRTFLEIGGETVGGESRLEHLLGELLQKMDG
ncbi:enoyl-CoA hydratase/isomerase family protein [Nocardia sp. NPDC058518]|uniref:enoyl-CoA hydratase/isomerase family protein n=1 Tax=Nocardia sp. NPDC058518 TaxID=3346534 RepID=UPI003653A78C